MTPARFVVPAALSISLLSLAAAMPALAAAFTVPPDDNNGIAMGAGDTLVVGNGGDVTNTSGSIAVTGTGAASIEIATGGTVTGVNATAIELSGGLTSFINHGTVAGGAFSSQTALRITSGTLGSFFNDGTMTSNIFNAVYLDAGVNVTGTFTNAGTIRAGTDQTVRIGGTVNSFVNTIDGEITNDTESALSIGGMVTSLSNAGLIEGEELGVRLGGGVGTATNSGTIRSSMTSGTAVNIWTNSGTFNNTGTIEGQFGLFFQNIATGADVTNSGTIKGGTGGAAITLTDNDDGLKLTTTSQITGIVDGRSGTDTLTLIGSGSGVFAADEIGASKDFRNLELFAKTGSGKWRFTGDNAVAMAWNVSNGGIRVDGDLRNTYFELNGGTLSGNGRVGTVDVNSGAAVAPGNSVGTLTTGDITFAAGSVYEVEIDGTSADLLDVIGTAILSGGTVNITGSVSACGAVSIPILTASNALTDMFAGLTGVSGGTLSYGSNSVSIDFAGSGGRTFTGFGTTPNQEATALALDALGCNNQPYSAQLNALTDAEVPAAMDALSGEGHASIAAAMIEDSGYIAGAIGDRLEQAFDSVESGVTPNAFGGGPSLLDPGAIDGLSIWGSGYGGLTNRAGDGNASAIESSAGGFVIGADGKVSEDWRMGLVAGLGVSAIDADATNGSSIDATLGGYAGAQIGIIEIKAGAAYTRHLIETGRSIIFPGVNDTMTASYQAGTAQAFVEISTDIEAGPVTVTPFAKLAGLSHATDAFTETGGAGRLHTAASVSNALFVTLGVGAEHEFVLNETMLVTARGSIGWRHAFADQVKVANSFVGGGPFSVASAGLASDVAVVSAGVSVDVSESVSLDISYEGELAAGLSSHAVKLTLSGKF